MKTPLEEVLEQELTRLKNKNAQFLGYPLSRDMRYDHLAPFLNLQLNNVGDPYTTSSIGIDTKQKEIEVLRFFGGLLRASEDTTWGYITNGGSEGNLYALYLAREKFPNGLVYYSESTHYSVRKNIHLLNVPSIVIRSQANGEMDYLDLEETVKANRRQPAIFFVNIGTTMHEAIDDLSRIKDIIRKYAIKEYYIHCDGALAGAMAPFYANRPSFDFKDGIDSISISGHKFIGSPIPCGIVLCQKEDSERVGRSISYVATKDTTITGSRNGLSPLILWSALKQLGVSGLKERYLESLKLAEYTLNQLHDIGWKASKNEHAVTVVLNRPGKAICEKYQLATEDDIAHIICLPGVSKKRIDMLVADLAKEDALYDGETQDKPGILEQMIYTF